MGGQRERQLGPWLVWHSTLPWSSADTEQPSLASVGGGRGGGMAAGTAFAGHPRAADARVSPIFLTHM